jgi:hypothetical protein
VLTTPKVAGHLLAGTFALFCFANSLLLLSAQIPRLFLLDENSYGETYVLYDVLHFQNTSEIYRDLSQPPYLPTQYSPLMYMLYSLPGRVIAAENPFVGPRVVALAAFISCVAVVISIVRVLIPLRYAWIWALLLATSMIAFRQWAYWIISPRGDLPGIVFSLLAIRLLLSRSSYAAFPAGLCAGLATQFKITLVAALAAGFLWLLFRKRCRESAAFAVAAALSSPGLYLFFWVHEPRMFSQMTALSPGIKDLRGWFTLTFRAVRESVVLLALLALPPVASRCSRRWTLLFLFALISFVSAAAIEMQAGANINYFFEALLALVPAAVFGIFRLIHWTRQRIRVTVFLSATVLFYLLPTAALDLYQTLWLKGSYQDVESSNHRFREAQNALGGLHIFSTVPRLALLDTAPALTEPYLMAYMQQLRKFDPLPILQRVRDKEFDVVITFAQSTNWRGVPRIAPELHHAIEAAYEPQCTMIEALIHLPRGRPAEGDLLRKLDSNGCMPLRGRTTEVGSGW